MERKYADDRVAYTNGKQNMINKILGKWKREASMLRLRPYNKSDAEIIMSWIKDERAFCKWTAGVLG